MEELAAILKKVIKELDIPKVMLQQREYTVYEIGQKIPMHHFDQMRDHYHGGSSAWRCWFQVMLSKGEVSVTNIIERPIMVSPLSYQPPRQTRNYLLADPNFFVKIISNLKEDIKQIRG